VSIPTTTGRWPVAEDLWDVRDDEAERVRKRAEWALDRV
jgi:hypothetical protein